MSSTPSLVESTFIQQSVVSLWAFIAYFVQKDLDSFNLLRVDAPLDLLEPLLVRSTTAADSGKKCN